MTDVTVITPSFGYGRFIEDSILSVQGQDSLDIQHVIQDGGSTDQTLEILKGYGSSLDWVSERDRGQSDALNKGFQRATGRWVAWLNADEFYLPGGLEALVARGERTSADVVYGDNVFVDEAGRVMRLLPQHPFSDRILRSYGCFIASSSMILRRTSLSEQPWDPDIRMMMDWDLYMKLSTQGAHFESIKYPVGAFRRHLDQVTANPKDFRDEYVKLFARYGISVKSRRWGRWLHRLAKLVSGAYGRQLRARTVSGCDLRWFRTDEGTTTFLALLRAGYGVRNLTKAEASITSPRSRARGDPH
jgi:glycosyltransferase involved in cell wall biosynthesis